ncbi:hypothetical protein Tco_0280036, partial [Tanacetum coccineum]
QTQNFGLHGQRKNPVTQFMYQKKNKDETKMDKQCSKNDAGKSDNQVENGEQKSPGKGSIDKTSTNKDSTEKVNGSDKSRKAWNVQGDFISALRKYNNGIEKGMESDNIEGMDKGVFGNENVF